MNRTYNFNFEYYNDEKSVSCLIPYKILGLVDVHSLDSNIILNKIFKNIYTLSQLHAFCSKDTFKKISQLKKSCRNIIFECNNMMCHPKLKEVFILE